MSALIALGAEVEIAGAGGRRTLAVEHFVTGALSVALGPGEILVAVRVPALPPGAAWGYVKHCAKIGEFAHAIGAVFLEPSKGRGRAVIGAVEGPPVLLTDARPLFDGRIGTDFAERFDPQAADAALRAAGMEDSVERHIHVTVLGRAVAQAGKPAPVTVQEAA